MAGKDQYKAAEFIKAIKGSGGIITTIANRVGCDWHTAKRYINDYATIKQAYDNECEAVTDMAESVLITSIKNGDSADAKWWLTRKGKARGFSDKLELELTLNELEKLSDDELRAIAES